jgi:excinuclease ABC subunit A
MHFADVEKLLGVLNGLVDKGNTVVVIEHNLDVIKCADYVIDMGPEGGSGGGQVIATGTPEQVAANPVSYTGQFLAPILAGRGHVPGKEQPPAANAASNGFAGAHPNGHVAVVDDAAQDADQEALRRQTLAKARRRAAKLR